MTINCNNSFYQNLEVVQNKPQSSSFFRMRSSKKAKETVTRLFEEKTSDFALFSSAHKNLSVEKQDKYSALFAKKFFLDGKYEDSIQCFKLLHNKALTPAVKLIHAVALFRLGKLVDSFEQLSLLDKIDGTANSEKSSLDLKKISDAEAFNAQIEKEINAMKAAFAQSSNKEERDFGSLVAFFDPVYCKQFSQRVTESDLSSPHIKKLIPSIVKNRSKIETDDTFTPELLIRFFCKDRYYNDRQRDLDNAIDIYESTTHKTTAMQYYLGKGLVFYAKQPVYFEDNPNYSIELQKKETMGIKGYDLLISALNEGLLDAGNFILNSGKYWKYIEPALRHVWTAGFSKERTPETNIALDILRRYYEPNRGETSPIEALLKVLLENNPRDFLNAREAALLRKTCISCLGLGEVDVDAVLQASWLSSMLPTTVTLVEAYTSTLPSAPPVDSLTEDEPPNESTTEPKRAKKKQTENDSDNAWLKKQLKIMEGVEKTPSGF